MKARRGEIWAWALYDWGNSAFATTVMAGFFPLFFKTYWAGGAAAHESTLYLGAANSLAAVLVAAGAPFLGAAADGGRMKKRFLLLFAALGVAATAALALVGAGLWPLAAALFILASLGFAGGNIFYDSLLPGLASGREADYASSLGFALGYLGGGVLFTVNVLMYLHPGLFGLPDETAAVRASFLTVALWWGLFSLPLFLRVRERGVGTAPGLGAAFPQGWARLRRTCREIKNLRVVGLFLAAYWFYMDGVDTVIRMAVDYGMAVGLPPGDLIAALLLVQFVAFPCTLAFNGLAGKTGPKAALLGAVAAYGLITVGGAAMTRPWHFWALACAIGAFQGGIQAISRSLYARLIPPARAGEFFGFYNMTGKFAAVVGPGMVGAATYVTADNRLGILTLLLLFGAAFVLLRGVDVAEGERLAREVL